MLSLQRFILLLLLIGSSRLWVQIIQNPGFETPRDTSRTLPAGWELNKSADYVVVLDSTVAKNGRRSLKIASLVDAPTSTRGLSQRWFTCGDLSKPITRRG